MVSPDQPAESVAPDDLSCCPFKTTPGRLAGGWTNCIHGMIGRKNELLRELGKLENDIFLWQVETGRHLGGKP